MTNPTDPGTQPPEPSAEPPSTPTPPAQQPAEPPPVSWAPPPPPAEPTPQSWAPAPPPPAYTPPPPTAWSGPVPETGPAPGVKFANLGSRLFAYIVDGLIVGVVWVIAMIILTSIFVAGAGWDALTSDDFRAGRVTPAMAGAIAGFVLLVIALAILTTAYFPYFWARSGQTPGMRMFGLYVVRDSDGGKISGGQAILRLIGLWVAAIPFYLGYIWVFIDARRRGWHDLIAGTVVIERA